MKLVERTLEATMIQRPEPTSDLPQNMCLDKGTTILKCERWWQPGVTQATFVAGEKNE